MAFDWKKKLAESKKAASEAFGKAVEKGTELAAKAEQKAAILSDKIDEQTIKAVNKVEEVISKKRAQKKPAPKSDTPKQG
ncbi:MAG: hypothetical protein GC185_07255 [Alphaproteobacteria bacterium]|nr:hypothetical protein [Alphaproteobacteria bacterium]